MSPAITITGNQYSVRGTIKNVKTNEGIADLQVLVYDKDDFWKDEFLGIGVTDAKGQFSISFDAGMCICLTRII